LHEAPIITEQHHIEAICPMLRRCMPALAFCLQFSSTAAFESNPKLCHYRRTQLVRPRHRPALTLNRCSDNSQCCHSLCPDGSGDYGSRRVFLTRFSSIVASGAVLTRPCIFPPLAFADDEDAANKAALNTVEILMRDETELNADILREEEDEKKVIEDERRLLDELEKEIQVVDNSDELSSTKEVEDEADKVKDGTKALIKEEEKLKNETEEIIMKIEAMESEVQSLDGAGEEKRHDGVSEDEYKKTASESFVDKLKESVEQKEDLITRLKRRSEMDVDPKTGKFKSMTPSEYRERVKSTDVDFIQFLKDTVANEQELENDLSAFEGLLEKEIGPVVRELRKDLKPKVGEAEKGVGPFVGEIEHQVEGAIQQLKENAKSAVDGEVEDLKHRAGDLIGKLRSIL
jgi:hypothetical protein